MTATTKDRIIITMPDGSIITVRLSGLATTSNSSGGVDYHVAAGAK